MMKNLLFLAFIACLVAACNRNTAPDPKSEEQSATCAARLRLIDGAKKLWADKNGKTTNDTPKLDDLLTYMRGAPACPSGGAYTMTPVGQLTTCSIPEHNAYYEKQADK
jgi:hypothetical protein